MRLRGRKAALEALVMYFMEKGEVLTRHEYGRQSDTPLRIGQVENYFGSWQRLVNIIENEYSEAWAEIHAPEPEPAPEPAPKPAPKKKANPLESLSKAAKAEKSED